MPRPKNITPSLKLHVALPGDLGLRLQLYLTVPALGRVPQGAYQEFFVERIQEFFARMEEPPKVHADQREFTRLESQDV